ncbi:MAG: zf-TFIIB domain-containing protein [Polyangiaceae bacterium]|nr:zf-TFIIB domain-containing protein [Polyangiaceae bacterium]
MDCPRCNKPLVPGRLAAHSLVDKVHVCEACEGSFVGPQELADIEVEERTAFIEERDIPNRKAQAVPLRCPACAVGMQKVVSTRDAKVVMDVCPKCHHTWLDHGEIEAIQTDSLFAILGQLFRRKQR